MDGSAPPAAAVRNVCFAFGRSEVLHNVSFELPPRCFAAVIGPNGGGKTTLLRLLLGELKPRFGSVEVLGRRPAQARSDVGFVPQSAAFDSDFPVSVREVAALGCRCGAFGGISARDRERADRALEKVGLKDFGDKPFGALSGGQRQRAMVAQAIAGEPKLLLLDEPTANVDPETEGALYDLFAEMSLGAAVVMVSHDRDVVSRRATHLLCVNRGADLHDLGESGDHEAVLEPIAGHDRARIRNEHPAHVEELCDHAGRTPHLGEGQASPAPD